jgi:DNA-binding GntR family transcriptional regulator
MLRKATSNDLAIEELRALRELMQTAFDAGQWQELADLDNDCRLVVGRIMTNPKVSVFDELTVTLRFYAELLSDCEQCRNQIAERSISLRHSKASGQVYRTMNVVR